MRRALVYYEYILLTHSFYYLMKPKYIKVREHITLYWNSLFTLYIEKNAISMNMPI